EQREEQVTIRRVGEVEDEAALAAVVDRVRDHLLLPAWISSGRLDPDHVGAVVGEDSGRPRSSRTARAVDDTDPVQRTWHEKRLEGSARSHGGGEPAAPAELRMEDVLAVEDHAVRRRGIGGGKAQRRLDEVL